MIKQHGMAVTARPSAGDCAACATTSPGAICLRLGHTKLQLCLDCAWYLARELGFQAHEKTASDDNRQENGNRQEISYLIFGHRNAWADDTDRGRVEVQRVGQETAACLFCFVHVGRQAAYQITVKQGGETWEMCHGCARSLIEDHLIPIYNPFKSGRFRAGDIITSNGLIMMVKTRVGDDRVYATDCRQFGKTYAATDCRLLYRSGKRTIQTQTKAYFEYTGKA